MDHARICSGMGEYGGADEVVDVKYVGLRDGLNRFQGQIVWVPWAGSNEGHRCKNSVMDESSHGYRLDED